MKMLRVVGLAIAALAALLVLAVVLLYAMFDGDKLKAEVSRVVLEQKQRTLVIAGKPQLSVWPDVGIELEGVTLSERGSTVQFASLQSARVSVAVMPLLRQQVQVRALEVSGLQATLVKKKDGTLNIADLLAPSADAAQPAAQDQAPAFLQIDVAGVRIANAQLTWRDEKAGSSTNLSNLSLSTGAVRADTGKKTAYVEKLSLTAKGQQGTDAFALTMDAPQLTLSPEKSAGDSISLSATLQGEGRNAMVNLQLSGVEGNTDALKLASLALQLDAKVGSTVLVGQLSSPVAVNVTGQSVALDKLAGSVELAHPDMPMKRLLLPLNGSLKVDALHQTATLDLGTKFDESQIAAHVKVGKFAPLVLAFDLSVDTLNVDKYLPPKPAGAEPAKDAAVGKDAPINLGALKGPAVQGAVRLGALQVSNLKLTNVNAKLALAGGKLDVAPLALNLYEGSTSGSLSLNANGNVVALKQTLTGVSINPLMKDLVNKDLLEGRGNVVLDVSTRGDTVGAMKKALAGTAALALKDGAIKGINLAQTLRDVKAKLGQADATKQANASQKTDFSELTGSFKIANGVARNDDLVMKSPFIRLGGSGDVDVGAGQMNYLAKATLVASGEGQGGKDAAQLRGLTVPVRVSGPFEALSYKLELGALLEDATKAKVEEKKQEIKAKAEEAVRDKTKDLLKGVLGK